MKKVIKTVEELYGRKDGTGEVILDEMAECLRKTRIIAVADLAVLMDVDAHQLNQAVRLLTGMTTRDIINRWRLLQACELLAASSDGAAKEAAKDDRIRLLNAVARRCGWRSYRVLLKVAHRYGVKLEIL
jgi:methylphosphotriester-DNA--protein-cysteine methyltransferase